MKITESKTRAENRGKNVRPKRLRAEQGALYVIDEAHLFFNARDRQKFGIETDYFISKHSKK